MGVSAEVAARWAAASGVEFANELLGGGELLGHVDLLIAIIAMLANSVRSAHAIDTGSNSRRSSVRTDAQPA